MALIAIAFLLVVIEVSSRLLDRPLNWVLETTEYSLAILTFLGAAWVLKQEGHVSIDFVLSRLTLAQRAAVSTVTSFASVVVCGSVVWLSTLMTISYWERGVRFVTEVEPIQGPFLTVIPFGFLILFIQFSRRTVKFWNEWRRAAEVPAGEEPPERNLDREL